MEKEKVVSKEVFDLCSEVREVSFALHNYLRNGHLEKVYENGMVNRLRKKGIKAEQQVPLKVYDEDGTLLGDYFADILVDDRLILELKAVRTVHDEHVAQLLGYLRSSRIEHGMLINFGASRLHVKKYAMLEDYDT